MTHHFSIDPRAVLGVAPSASVEDIRDAFREKSKKHHPDHGGDEWAFRIVVRAYEILKATRDISEPCAASRAASPASGFQPGPVYSPTAEQQTAFFNRFRTATDPSAGGSDDVPPEDESYASDSGVEPPRAAPPSATEFRTVDVELVWIRVETVSSPPMQPRQDSPETTLSVCLVLYWPRRVLVKYEAQFPDAAEKLRIVIETFEVLRGREGVLGARSRIEDGQFVGWLSFPDVLQTEAEYRTLQKLLLANGMSVSLQTCDVTLPAE
jgi:hypothetical protein